MDGEDMVTEVAGSGKGFATFRAGVGVFWGDELDLRGWWVHFYQGCGIMIFIIKINVD